MILYFLKKNHISNRISTVELYSKVVDIRLNHKIMHINWSIDQICLLFFSFYALKSSNILVTILSRIFYPSLNYGSYNIFNL